MDIQALAHDARLGELPNQLVHDEEDEKSDTASGVTEDQLHDSPGDDHRSHTYYGKEIEKRDEQGDEYRMRHAEYEKSRQHYREGYEHY